MPGQSFRNRLIAAFLTIAIVPLLLTSILVGWHSYNTHIGDSWARQTQRADSIALQVETFLRNAEREIRVTIRLAGGETSAGSMRQLLERLLADRSAYREIAVLDRDGNERLRLSNVRLVSADGPALPFDPARLRGLSNGESHLDPIQFDESSGEPLMLLWVPALSPRTGELTSVVVAELRARAIWDVIARQQFTAGESAYVIEEDGHVVAHLNPSLVLGGHRGTYTPDRRWQTGLDGGSVLAVGVAADFGGRSFTVVVERAFSAAVQPALEALQLIGMITIFTLGVALVLFAVAVRSVVRPIQMITTAAVAVGDGDYDRSVEIDSRDEIGLLAKSFNTMTARLRVALSDLKIEIEERRLTEIELIKVNKAYQALSAATSLLDSADDQQYILDEVCRIVVSDCGYRLAWIGFLDGGLQGRVRPVAHAGFDDGYVHCLDIDLTDPLRGQGPASVCVREARPVIVEDIATDPSCGPWREDARKRGYAAVTTVPLLAEKRVLGLLAVYSAKADSMSEKEVRLLGQLASNLAQGLMSLRLRQERARAEQDLRDSEARLREITNAVPALVWMLGRDGVTYFNQRFYDFTGLDEASALKFGWHQSIHPEDLPKITSEWDAIFAVGDHFEMECRVRRADGTYCWFLVQGEPIDSADGNRIWFGTCIDIEDRKRSELQLIQASKLATLGEMAASMAHELGQPLNLIRITSDDAAERVADGSAAVADMGTALQAISKQTVRMGEIIEHMRVFSRDDNLRQEVFDVPAVIQSASSLVAPQLAAHGIALRLTLPPQPAHILGNRIQFEQVILNLVNNARDAIEADGVQRRLGTSRGRIEISVESSNDTVDVTVTDDGPGISPDAFLHLFEPFFTTKPLGKGTGLGLAISQRIVERMGGTLKAVGAQQGAKFLVSLPVTTAPLKKPGSASASKPCIGAANRLLLVDDEPTAVELLEEILSRRGFEVTVAHDCGQAMTAFAEHRPDLVITDITMPQGDGMSLVRHMRESRPDVPVIFMTGSLDAASLLAGELQTGRARLLRKPVAIDDLVRTAVELLGEDAPFERG